jgi:hypothetical protein
MCIIYDKLLTDDLFKDKDQITGYILAFKDNNHPMLCDNDNSIVCTQYIDISNCFDNIRHVFNEDYDIKSNKKIYVPYPGCYKIGHNMSYRNTKEMTEEEISTGIINEGYRVFLSKDECLDFAPSYELCDEIHNRIGNVKKVLPVTCYKKDFIAAGKLKITEDIKYMGVFTDIHISKKDYIAMGLFLQRIYMDDILTHYTKDTILYLKKIIQQYDKFEMSRHIGPRLYNKLLKMHQREEKDV